MRHECATLFAEHFCWNTKRQGANDVARARRGVIARAFAHTMRVFSRYVARRGARGDRARRHGRELCARGCCAETRGPPDRRYMWVRALWAVERDGVVSTRGKRDGMDARGRGARVRTIRAGSVAMR